MVCTTGIKKTSITGPATSLPKELTISFPQPSTVVTTSPFFLSIASFARLQYPSTFLPIASPCLCHSALAPSHTPANLVLTLSTIWLFFSTTASTPSLTAAPHRSGLLTISPPTSLASLSLFPNSLSFSFKFFQPCPFFSFLASLLSLASANTDFFST